MHIEKISIHTSPVPFGEAHESSFTEEEATWLNNLNVLKKLKQKACEDEGYNNLDDLVYDYWEEHNYDGELNNNECTKEINEKFKQNKTAYNMLKQFEGKRPNYHLEWKLKDLGPCTTNPLDCFTGQTVPPYPQTLGLIKIELNTQMISTSSKICIAKTMLHELLHAYIFDLARKDSPDWIPVNPEDFPSLWNAYQQNISDYSHEYIANHYISIMTSALQSIANDLNIQVSDSDLNAIAWSGLHNTTKWNEKTPEEKQAIRAVWNQNISTNECQ